MSLCDEGHAFYEVFTHSSASLNRRLLNYRVQRTRGQYPAIHTTGKIDRLCLGRHSARQRCAYGRGYAAPLRSGECVTDDFKLCSLPDAADGETQRIAPIGFQGRA
jgi:hypothetical protein